MPENKIIDKISLDNNTYIIKDSDAARLVHTHNDKVDKEDGKGLSTNDFTNEDKAKLNTINLYFEELEDSNNKE